MAEGKPLDGSTDGGVMGSLDADPFCAPCKFDGKHLPAEGYCVTCGHHLCEPCFKGHLLALPMRSHKLKNKEEMPMASEKEVEQKTSEYKCALHPNEHMTSYCTTHDQLCCPTCVVMIHHACKDVKDIKEVSMNLRESNDFKQLVDKLRALERRNKAVKEEARLNTERIDDIYNRCVDDFSAALCKIKDNDKSNNRAVQTASDSVLQQVALWQNDIERHKNNKDDNSLFILLKIAGKTIDLMEVNTEYIEKENAIETYDFIQGTVNEVIGKVMRVPYLVKEISAKHSSESSTCNLRDIKFLNKTTLLVTGSSRNYSIKIINLESGSVDAQVILASNPWGVAVTDNNQAYVTQPSANKILHLPAPLNNLSNYKEITIESISYSIQYIQDALRVEKRSTPLKIVELGLDGKMKRTLVNDCGQLKTDNGEQMLTNPCSSTLTANGESVVFSDFSQNSVVEIKNDGTARLIVKSSELKNPFGIILDTDGSFLVCSYNGKKVLRVSDSGLTCELISELPFNPSSLALDEVSRILYVGGFSDLIYAYRI